METIGSKRSYALTWCMPNNDDDDDVVENIAADEIHTFIRHNDSTRMCRLRQKE